VVWANDQAIPVLLSCIKPILSHLSSPNPVNEDEDMSKEAKAAIGNYMDILDVRPFSSIILYIICHTLV